MNNLFQNTSSYWVKFSEYEFVTAKDGKEYIKATPKARPEVYDPLKNADVLVIDAVNVGMLQMGRSEASVVKTAVLDFVSKYGLLGFMTALPTTPKFMDYDAAYLPKNHFIKEEMISVTDYTTLFFPFEELDYIKNKNGVCWDISGDGDMMALALTFGNDPMALNMSFQREYAERYDWLLTQFKDWAFSFFTSFLYYEDYDTLNETTRNLYRQSMVAFGGIAPTYHIALLDKPTIVWDFHSLLLGVQMMLSFMLTDEKKPLRTCRHCKKAFAANHPKAAFCSARCKNQFNVYKSRSNKKDAEDT